VQQAARVSLKSSIQLSKPLESGKRAGAEATKALTTLLIATAPTPKP